MQCASRNPRRLERRRLAEPERQDSPKTCWLQYLSVPSGLARKVPSIGLSVPSAGLELRLDRLERDRGSTHEDSERGHVRRTRVERPKQLVTYRDIDAPTY
jgi:hypothetical protein